MSIGDELTFDGKTYSVRQFDTDAYGVYLAMMLEESTSDWVVAVFRTGDTSLGNVQRTTSEIQAGYWFNERKIN